MSVPVGRPFQINVEYDEEARVLTVRFASASFRYKQVPAEKGRAIVQLHGSELLHAFDSGIEGKYQSERCV